MHSYFEPWDPEQQGWGTPLVARVDHLESLHATVFGENTFDPNRSCEVILEELWQELTELNMPYLQIPWSASSGQIIRDADWVTKYGGTCLDLVVFVAGLAIARELRPIVLLIDHPSGNHAALAIDLKATISDWEDFESWKKSRGVKWALPFRHMPAPDHVKISPQKLLDLVNEGSIALLDPTKATRDEDHPADRGAGFVTDMLNDATCIRLIDVQAVAVNDNDEVKKVERPDISHRPAISYQVPPMAAWSEYPEREGIVEQCLDILKGSHRLVITGAAGQGKSTFSRMLIARLRAPSAWFLPASSEPALRSALAGAMARELGLAERAEVLYEQLAAAALNRLEESQQPWTVVLDNVIESPQEIRKFIPAGRGREQRIIVTTSGEMGDDTDALQAWEHWAGGPKNVVSLHSINVPDDKIIDTLLEVVGLELTPLLLRLIEPLIERGSEQREQLEKQLDEGDLNAAGFEGIVNLCLSGLSADARQKVSALAWLPPEGLSGSAIGGVLHELWAAGLLIESAFAPRSYDLHRLIGDAIRTIDDDTSTAVLCIENPELSRVLRSRADLEVLTRIGDAVRTEWEEGDRNRKLDLVKAVADLGEILESMGRVAEASQPDWSRAETVDRAIALQEDLHDDLRKNQPMSLATALHGAARGINQSVNRSKNVEEIVQGIKWADTASKIRKDGGGSLQKIHASGSEALASLLRSKLYRLTDDSKKVLLSHLAAELEVLNRVKNERVELIDEIDQPPSLELQREKARSIFNLGGASNDLALEVTRALRTKSVEVEKVPDVTALLDAATEAYRGALELREQFSIDEGRADESIAACYFGLGLIDYQRSWMLVKSTEDRIELLRTGSEFVTRSMEIRSRIDNEDGQNVAKSLKVSVKISNLRLRLSNADELEVLAKEINDEEPA